MSKTLVTRQELALIALQEIRRFRGSEHVTTVEVEHQIDSARDTNWTLHVVLRDNLNAPRRKTAVRSRYHTYPVTASGAKGTFTV